MHLNKRAEIIEGKKNIYTHLVFAAHQDDVEIMCGDGIVQCYDDEKKGLVAVIVGNGSGSPRSGKYANFTNEQMVRQRRTEQIRAAKIGRYAALIFLNYPSAEINSENSCLIADIQEIAKEFLPGTIYTHNPADKHNTHINVLKSVLSALRAITAEYRPQSFLGCECWRDLDWLNDEDKVIFDLSGHKRLLRRLIAAHKSQIRGGKRYDLAIQGRRLANATFSRSHAVNTAELVSFGIDLSPLLSDPGVSLRQFTENKIDAFKRQLLM